MGEWWSGLTGLNQAFFSAASFFSVFFLWQLLSAIIGLGGGESEVDADGGVDIGDGEVGEGTYDGFEEGAHADAAETIAAFKLLSIRSILTFFTLFTWGGALYLNAGVGIARTLAYSTMWGLAGMLSVALVFYILKKLTQVGNINLSTCVGQPGTVYLDIAENSSGEIRVKVSDVVSYVRARAADKKEIKAGQPVRVVRRLNQNTVEVETID